MSLKETLVQVLIVEVNVKPETRDRFIEVITDDASHSEADEPGCLRFDVLQDAEDQNKFYFYEVYKDAASVAAHRETAHFARFFKALPELMEGTMGRHVATNLHPKDAAWR